MITQRYITKRVRYNKQYVSSLWLRDESFVHSVSDSTWECSSRIYELAYDVGDAVASWLVRSFPDRAVRVRAPAGDIVLCSWARHFTLTVPLTVVKLKPEKISGLNRIRTHDLCDNGAVLYQLSYQANWELATLRVRYKPVEGEEHKWIYERSYIVYIWTAENNCERNQKFPLPCAIGEFAKLNKLDSRMVKVWLNMKRQLGRDEESSISSASSGGNEVVEINEVVNKIWNKKACCIFLFLEGGGGGGDLVLFKDPLWVINN